MKSLRGVWVSGDEFAKKVTERRDTHECSDCGGSGKIHGTLDCPACEGTGRIPKTLSSIGMKSVEVTKKSK